MGYDTSFDWEAYRRAVFAAADSQAASYPSSDPRAAVPEALRPGKHHVHSAYIWLDGVFTVAAVLIALGFSMMGSIVSLIQGGGLAASFPIILVVIVGLVLVAVIAALIFVVQWLSWKHLSYELTPTEFNMYSGVISKKRVHVPYQRVQSVNQRAGLLQRMLGLCNVKIDTAGGAANEAVQLRYVRNSDAEALRAELFRRKKVLLAGGSIDKYGNAFLASSALPSAWMIACSSGSEQAAYQVLGLAFPAAAHAEGGVARADEENVLDVADEILSDVRGVFGGDEVATGRVSYETGLSNKELLLASISGSAGSFGVVFAGMLGLVAFFEPVIESGIMTWLEAEYRGMPLPSDATFDEALASIAGGAMTSAFWAVALWTALGLCALWLVSLIATCVHYGGFKARRRESRIEVEYGLLQRTFHGVDIDRVQSVIIKQSFIRRLIGYCELSLGKIDSSTSDKDAKAPSQGVVVHPFVKVGRVPEILAGIAPEFSNLPRETVKPAPVALRRAIVRKAIIRSSAFWIAVSAVLLRALLEAGVSTGLVNLGPLEHSTIQAAFVLLLVLCAAAFIVNVANAVIWHKTSGMGYDNRFMSVTNGGLHTHTVVFPRKKIQYGYTKTNPFQRMAHVKIVAARTAAGIGGTTELLWDVPEEDADAWMEWVRPHSAKGCCPVEPAEEAF